MKFVWTPDMWACIVCRAPCIGVTVEPVCWEHASEEERERRRPGHAEGILP